VYILIFPLIIQEWFWVRET